MLADGAVVLLFEEAEDEGIACRYWEVQQGFVEMREEGVFWSWRGEHFGGDLFALEASGLTPDVIGCDAAGLAVEPSAEANFFSESGCFFSKPGEDFLRDILGDPAGVGSPSQGSGINQGHVLIDQLAEGLIGPVGHEGLNQRVAGFAHCREYSAAVGISDKGG